MTDDGIAQCGRELAGRPPGEVIRRVLDLVDGRAVVSTNFRPYEAVLLHLATRARPDIPVLWVDHGFNRPATYRHAEALRRQMGLNLKTYVPRITAAHYEALHGPPPGPENEAALREFSALCKLEPFRRGMEELAPAAWFTALRRTQNPGRAQLSLLGWDPVFATLKVNALLDWTDPMLEAYLGEHGLPNEWDYFDPAKADEKRECGLHAAWAGQAVEPVRPLR